MYGVEDLKTHCKLCLVVRQEPGGVRRYAHIGTGNYNRATSQVYTDFGLFTADPAIVDDVSDIFNSLTGYAQGPRHYDHLLVAPSSLRERVEQLVENEIVHAQAGARGAHHRQGQRRHRSRDHSHALSRVAGRRAHRPDRAGRVLPAAGRRGSQRLALPSARSSDVFSSTRGCITS